MLVGSNAAWCHPVLFRRMQDNRRTRGARIVVIDPRRTQTGDEADLFLAIAPGTDTALFCGLLVHLAETGALDGAFIDGHTSGFGDALAQARAVAPDIAATAAATGLAAREVAAFFDLFRSVEKVVTLYSQGVNQSAQGTDKVGAIINCHLATGRIGRPGLGPFSLTGQPNAMGGREVGGLANMLAAHMGFSAPEVDRVRRFWKAPRIADREGDKAVALFRRIAEGGIKALWIMATNPAVSLPDADTARAALQQARSPGRLRERALDRQHLARRACPAAGLRLGREGRHGHEFRAAHLAPARLPAGSRRGEAGLVDRQRGGAAHGVRRGLPVFLPGRDLRRARGALRVRERRQPRFRHRRPRGAFRRGLRHPCAGAVAVDRGR